VRGTYAAGGSDSSCYVLMAEAFAAGKLQPTSELAAKVPWPDALRTFTPGGFLPSQTRPSSFSPICAAGFSLLLAPLGAALGPDGFFFLTPIAGAALVWLAFSSARALAGPWPGAMSAVLVAASPAVLYQVVQPMNDIVTAALWLAVFRTLVARRWALAGACCGLALLVRPNLLPLAIVAGVFVVAATPRSESAVAKTSAFCLAALPFGIVILWLNHGLYGSAFRTGYGQLNNLFGLGVMPTNMARYVGWLAETHTLFPLLAFAAPIVVPRERRTEALLAVALIVASVLVYFLYTPFDDWTYLRFLLPAIALMTILASVVALHTLSRLVSGRSQAIVATLVTAALAALYVRSGQERHAFNMRFLEQRYRSAGVVVRDHLPADAVILSVWDSGAVRFHGRKEALAWESLDPAWLDRSLEWLAARGRTPFILVESWEEPWFRSRFAGYSAVGRLDWPPKYEIDRVVRVYDPRDRPRFDRGERVQTEYLWPLLESAR
jgi:hypothetical protein